MGQRDKVKKKENPEIDTQWWDEKNQGFRVAINHKGLMPSCFSCNAKYKLSKSDKDSMPFKVEHPKNGCPFLKTVYGKTEFECVVQLKKELDEVIAKRK